MKHRIVRILIPIAVVIVGTGIWFIAARPRERNEPREKITIACMSHSFTGFTIFVATGRGFFQGEGLDVSLDMEYPHGKAALEAVSEGQAALGVSSETPFMHAVLSGRDLCTFVSMFSGEKHLAIVARRDRGILTAKDLEGRSIGVTLGTNGEYFLDTVLLLNGVSRADTQTVDLKPAEMFDSIVAGRVDAIATWNPQMYRARKTLGEAASVFYAEGLYTVSFLLSARREYARKNQRILEKAARALLKASEFIHSNPSESRETVAGYLGIDQSLLQELSAVYHFRPALDQSLLLTMEHQSKWAIAHRLTDRTEVPNYLDFLFANALEAVAPEAVTIIR